MSGAEAVGELWKNYAFFVYIWKKQRQATRGIYMDRRLEVYLHIEAQQAPRFHELKSLHADGSRRSILRPSTCCSSVAPLFPLDGYT